jgi:hypothetical protein
MHIYMYVRTYVYITFSDALMYDIKTERNVETLLYNAGVCSTDLRLSVLL